MKIRNGFVSNSSSSSFLVAFASKPKSIEELRKLMFGDEKILSYPSWDTGREENIQHSTYDIAELVFNIIQQSKPLDTKGIIEEISSGYFDGHPDYADYQEESKRIEKDFYEKYKKSIWDCKDDENLGHEWKRWREVDTREWKEYKKACEEAAKEYYKKFKSTLNKGDVYYFSFSDNDGQAYLEHGEIFSLLPHIQISHH
jgi:DNA-binding ferritin-like protein (Dps family)